MSSQASRASLSREAAMHEASERDRSPLCPSVYTDAGDDEPAAKAQDAAAAAAWHSSCSLRNIARILLDAAVEAVAYGVVFMAPALAAHVLTPGGEHGQAAAALARWAAFAAGTYGGWVLAQGAVRVLPLLLRRSFLLVAQAKGSAPDATRLPYGLRLTLAGLRRAHAPLSAALAALWALLLHGALLRPGSALLQRAQDALGLEALGASGATRATERTLAVLALGALLGLLEGWLVEWLAAGFHRTALAARIRASNFAFRVLQRLHRLTDLDTCGGARRSLAHAARQRRLRAAAGLDDDARVQLAPDDTALALTDAPRAAHVGRALFAALCPPGRSYIAPDDLRAFFAPDDCAAAFAVLDPRHVGLVGAPGCAEAVARTWAERDALRDAVATSDRVLATLHRLLQALLLLLWALVASSALSPAHHRALLSASGLLLGLGFLLDDLAKRVFDCFIFILVQHPFDAGDRISLDGRDFVVEHVRLFSSRLRALPSGAAVYVPNALLPAKHICNLHRSPLATDALLLSLPPNLPLALLAALQDRIRAHLAATAPSFTGHVRLVPFECLPGAINVRVEVRHRNPDHVAPAPDPEALRLRKDALAAFLRTALDDLGIRL